MNTFCPNCGNPVVPNARFCPACGVTREVVLSVVAERAVNEPPSRSAALPPPVRSCSFCAICGVQAISDTAPFCTQCGSLVKASSSLPIAEQRPNVQVNVINAPHTGVKASSELSGSYGLPIPSMVIGIVFVLGVFDNSRWDSDTISGAAAFCIVGLVLGIVSVCRQQKGRGMAVAGIVLSSIALLAVIGRMS